VQVHLVNEAVKVFTLRGNDWTKRFRKIADDAWHIAAGSAIIDGEVVVPVANGTTDFSVLQNELKGKSTKIVLVAFDLLYLNGYDLRKLPLIERKAHLKRSSTALPSARCFREETGWGCCRQGCSRSGSAMMRPWTICIKRFPSGFACNHLVELAFDLGWSPSGTFGSIERSRLAEIGSPGRVQCRNSLLESSFWECPACFWPPRRRAPLRREACTCGLAAAPSAL
jgi:hypothetical protein